MWWGLNGASSSSSLPLIQPLLFQFAERQNFQLAATYFTPSRSPAQAFLNTFLLILVSS